MSQIKKIYLCGITQNQYENINELTENCYQYFDGLIFVDAGSTDGTLELLEQRKGCGRILYREWTNDHDLQMSEIVRRGGMENGDWFVLRDSRERFNLEWVKNIRQILQSLVDQGVNSIFNYGKGFAFAWNDNMVFQGSPHWGLQGAIGQAVDFKSFFSETEKEHTWRIPEGQGDRPYGHMIDHHFKYYFIYGRSNHLLLGNENNIDSYKRQEAERLLFRKYMHDLGVFSQDDMISYLKSEKALKDDNIKYILNGQRIMMDFYRKHVLGHSLEEIQNKEFKI